jgi:CBS domain-containing protein
MDLSALERLDSFPYRHRARELMTAPLVTIDAGRSIAEAAALMARRRVGSVVVLDSEGRAAGIVTEHDVLRLVARDPAQLVRPVSEEMSRPVHGIDADALIYRALARMARLGIRHLLVFDAAGRPLGMLTASALLKQRASFALTLADEIEQAADGAALRAAHERLPALVAALRREDVPATQISAVIAAVVCDLTEKAGGLALAAMQKEGQGDAPARWCLLVLGSAGRGEALLAADQDNALVHDGDDRSDAWFAAFGQRLNALLDAAGVPLCKGGVMAGNAAFRKSLPAWRSTIESWVARPRAEALMNVDIFYDFIAVLGDRALARELRRQATDAAAGSPVFLRLLAAADEDPGSAFDFLGRLRTTKGRVDLKRYGLFPVVAAARVIGLAWRSTATATDVRLAEAAAKGALSAEIVSELTAARAAIVEAILDQQLADIADGRVPSNHVEPRRLDRAALKRLRQALHTISAAPAAVHDALSSRAPEWPP